MQWIYPREKFIPYIYRYLWQTKHKIDGLSFNLLRYCIYRARSILAGLCVDCQQDSDWNSDVRNIVCVVAVPFCKRDFCVSPPSEKWTLRSDGGNDIPVIYYIKMTIVLTEKECRDDSNEIIPWMVDCSGTSFDDPIHVFMMKTRWRAFLMRWCRMGIIYYMDKLAS